VLVLNQTSSAAMLFKTSLHLVVNHRGHHSVATSPLQLARRRLVVNFLPREAVGMVKIADFPTIPNLLAEETLMDLDLARRVILVTVLLVARADKHFLI
jgi:hypothetical protein